MSDSEKNKKIQEQRGLANLSRVDFALGTNAIKTIDKSLMTGTQDVTKSKGGEGHKGNKLNNQ